MAPTMLSMDEQAALMNPNVALSSFIPTFKAYKSKPSIRKNNSLEHAAVRNIVKFFTAYPLDNAALQELIAELSAAQKFKVLIRLEQIDLASQPEEIQKNISAAKDVLSSRLTDFVGISFIEDFLSALASAKTPQQIADIQNILADPAVQNFFIHSALDVLSEAKHFDIFKKFIRILDDSQCLALCQKLLIIENTTNQVKVFSLMNCLLEKLLQSKFFDTMPLDQLADFMVSIPANNNERLLDLQKKVLAVFNRRMFQEEGQRFFIRLMCNLDLAVVTKQEKQIRHFEKILMSIDPYLLSGDAVKRWDEYIEQLAHKIDQLSEQVEQGNFSDQGNGYLMMRQVQRFLKMLDAHPGAINYKQRHAKLRAMRNKMIQANVEEELSSLFDSQYRVSRVFLVNPAEIAFDSTVVPADLSVYNQALQEQFSLDHFTHASVTQGNLEGDAARTAFKFALPDGSFFHGSKNPDGKYVLTQYHANGKIEKEFPPEIFPRLKEMLSGITYNGNHLPQSLIDYFLEYLLLQSSPLQYDRQMIAFLDKTLRVQNSGDASEILYKIQKGIEGQKSVVIAWNGQSGIDAKLSISNLAHSDKPFVELTVKQVEANPLPEAIHCLEKFDHVIDITIRDFAIDLFPERLVVLGLPVDSSTELFDAFAASALLKIEKGLILDRHDLRAILVKLETQLQTIGVAQHVIAARLMPLAEKWFFALYQNPTDTKALGKEIQRSAGAMLSSSIILASTEETLRYKECTHLSEEDIATFASRTSEQKTAWFKQLSKMDPSEKQKIADYVLQHNQIQVHFFAKGLAYFRSAWRNTKAYIKVAVRSAFKVCGMKQLRGQKIDDAITVAKSLYAQTKKERDERRAVFSGAFFSLGRNGNPLFTAKELYQLLTHASGKEIIAVLDDQHNQKILLASPEVLVDLYCAVQKCSNHDRRVKELVTNFGFNNEDFLSELRKKISPSKNAQLTLALDLWHERFAAIQTLAEQGNVLLEDSYALHLFLICAGENGPSIGILASKIDPIQLMDCYQEFSQDRLKTVRAQLNRLMSETLETSLVKMPTGAFMPRLLTMARVQEVLPAVLVELNQKSKAAETIVTTLIQQAGVGDFLPNIFGRNSAALILFLRYAAATQIDCVAESMTNLFSDRDFRTKFLGQPREQLQALLDQLNQNHSAVVEPIKTMLQQHLQRLAIEPLVVAGHPERPRAHSFQYIKLADDRSSPFARSVSKQLTHAHARAGAMQADEDRLASSLPISLKT